MADDIYRKARSGDSSVTADMFPNAEEAFVALGLQFADFIVIVNTTLANIMDPTARTKLAQTLVYIACITFNV
jgi:hypothetical protein